MNSLAGESVYDIKYLLRIVLHLLNPVLLWGGVTQYICNKKQELKTFNRSVTWFVHLEPLSFKTATRVKSIVSRGKMAAQ